MKAQEGGADRVELCDNPAEGGTTPSHGTIALVRQHLNTDVFVMIRPRGGDFLYSIEEYHAMKKDIEACKRLSVDGVVFGILKADGSLDKEKCKRLIEFARPLKATCHRAFDRVADPFQALEDCIEAGFDRILTSGLQKTADEGLDLIRQLVEKANGRIIVMPGGGIDENNAKEIVSKSNANEIHISARSLRQSKMIFRNYKIDGIGPNAAHEFEVRTVDPDRVRATRKAVRD